MNKKQKLNQKKINISKYIDWILIILLIIVVLYVRFGTNIYCKCPPIHIIDTADSLIQNISNYTINLTGMI